MIYILIIRFIRGYVDFVCSGGFPERFINLCALYGITLRNTKTEKNEIRATTDIASFRKIRPAVKKSGMKLKIIKKGGLPFIIAPYLRRKGLIAGITASIMLIVWLNSFIWTTDVRGNVNFTTEQIEEIGKEYGIYPGAEKNSLNVSDINKRIKNDFDDISWFALNIYGSDATLELTERFDKTKIYDKTTPCNIVSDEDGVVIELITLSGTPQIKTGSAVAKGDLLISGVTEKTDGSADFVHARGSAVIRTNKKIQSEVTVSSSVKRVKAVKEIYKITIFGISVDTGKADGIRVASFTRHLDYNDRILPVSVTRNVYCIFADEKLSFNDKTTVLLAANALFEKEKQIMKDSETEKKTVSFTKDNNSVIFTAEYINHRTTGIEKYFEVSAE